MTEPRLVYFVEFVCSDGNSFMLEESTFQESKTIKRMIEEAGRGKVIRLPDVTSHIFAKVIKYCSTHEEANDDDDLYDFDTQFVNVDQATLFDLVLAANYLEIKGLIDLTSRTVAGMMEGKTPEEIRERFSIENDYTPEEEKKMQEDNAWAFK